MQETFSLNEALLAFVENFSERGTAFMNGGELEFGKRHGIIVANGLGGYVLTEVGLKIKASQARCNAAPQRAQSGDVIGTGNALDMQVAGNHYKSMAIQPVEFIDRNKLPFLEGNVIKRMCRHSAKTGAGLRDLEKAKHEIDLIIQLRYTKVEG